MVKFLLLASMPALAIDLLLLGHIEGFWQWSPLVLLAAGFITMLRCVAQPTWMPLQILRILMMLFVISGVIGVFLHLAGNFAFELEMTPDVDSFDVLKEALTGATPALAPAAMAQVGLLGLIYMYRHPVLRDHRSAQEDRDA